MQFDCEAWERAWLEHARITPAAERSGRKRTPRLPARLRVVRTPAALATLAVLAAVPLAGAQSGGGDDPSATAARTGDPLREGRRNPTFGDARRETELIARIGASEGASGPGKGGFALRESNLSASGGGAVHGCRATKGNIDTTGFDAGDRDTKPCLRASNLSRGADGGRAFEFAFGGPTGGLIEHATGGRGAAPFATNATGVAPGLNADEVDGRDGDELLGKTEKAADSDLLDGKSLEQVVSWAVVAANGTLVRAAGAAEALRVNNGNYRVDLGRDVSQCAFFATPEDVAQNLTAHADLDVTDAERVFVSLRDAATAVRADGDFQLAVHC